MPQHPVAPAFSQHRLIRHRQDNTISWRLSWVSVRSEQIGAGKAAVRDIIGGHQLANRLFHNRQQPGEQRENQRLLVGKWCSNPPLLTPASRATAFSDSDAIPSRPAIIAADSSSC
jgi:hypothetical protein